MGAKVDLIGYVGADSQLRNANGRPVLSFRMGTTDPYDKSTTWWSVSLFGPRAEKLQSMVSKGKHIYVVGSVKEKSYMSNGEERTSLDVNAYDVQLLDRKNDGGNSGSTGSNADNDVF